MRKVKTNRFQKVRSEKQRSLLHSIFTSQIRSDFCELCEFFIQHTDKSSQTSKNGLECVFKLELEKEDLHENKIRSQSTEHITCHNEYCSLKIMMIVRSGFYLSLKKVMFICFLSKKNVYIIYCCHQKS